VKLLRSYKLPAYMTSEEFGPELILEFNYASEGCSGLIVVDSTLLGPSKGGLRIVKATSVEEICSLARVCTYRNALLDIPFGGGRSAIIYDYDRMDRNGRERLLRSFARLLNSTIRRKYIVEPDLNTGPEDMKAVAEELGRWNASAGKPRGYCTKGGRKSGIPHEPEVAALGIFHATVTAASQLNIPLRGMRVLSVGLGTVGEQLSSKLVGVGAHVTGILEPSSSAEGVTEGNSATGIPGFLKLGVDVIIVGCQCPRALVERISEEADAKLVIEGGDLALGHELRERLTRRDIVTLPDLVANCGGAVASLCELRGMRPETVPLVIEKRAVRSVIEVLGRAELQDMTPAEAAVQLAENKLRGRKKELQGAH